MTDLDGNGTPRSGRLDRAAPILGLILITVVAMGGVVANGWIQDERPLIQADTRIHTMEGLWSGFVEPWWAPPSTSGLYRPLARTLLTLQWPLSSGGPAAFKVGSLLAYLLAVLAVWHLARRLLPATGAWVAAALFAVHSVHTEAVAVAVNQGESLVVALSALMMVAWLSPPGGRRWWIALVLPYAAALGFKEHALVLPALLIAADLAGLRVAATPTDETGRRRAALALLVLVGAIYWGVRTAVLGGRMGTDPAEGIELGGAVMRALTMLAVVPEWARLLFWPAHLQTNYAPNELVPWSGWTIAHTLGLLLLVGAAGLAFWGRSRRPLVTFGIAWMAIALLPVSNLILPTGVLLAERTLMLASVGAVLTLVGLVAAPTWDDPARRRLIVLASGSLIALGAARSAVRLPDFRDSARYVTAMWRDAPESWHAQLAYGAMLMDRGERATGERLLRQAMAIRPQNTRAFRILAGHYRRDDLCVPAIPLYQHAIRIESIDQYSRLSLVACLLDRGDYMGAANAAREGAAGPGPALQEAFRAAVTVAERAERESAPPGTVRLPWFPGGHAAIGAEGSREIVP